MAMYGVTALERAMNVQEEILRAMGGEMTWIRAAHILGVTDRTMRRWKLRYERRGYDGLLDRRRRRPSSKRVPVAVLRDILTLYRESYAGFNVRHFLQLAKEQHGITQFYSFVKSALQGAGLVSKGHERGRHLRRRERKPCVGQMLHIDGSFHPWLQLCPKEKQVMIVVIDDC